MKLNDFLVSYYMQMHFNDMPAAVRAQFKKYADADDFRGNMKNWKKDLVDADGKNNPLPDAMDATVFEQADWEKFFNAFQNALRGMDANKKAFKDNDKATKFLAEYFGENKLFTISRAGPETESAITTLIPILSTHKSHLSIWLKQNGNLFETDADYNEFLDGLTTKKYNTDVKFQEKLKHVTSYLAYGRNEDAFIKNPQLTAALTSMGTGLDGIKSGFETSSIDPARMQSFRDEYPLLLRRLYKEDKTLEVFANNDNGKISSPLKEALGKTDFGNKDSKDFVPPKRTDELTLGQQISDWAGDTYSDSLEKYIKLRGDRLYVSPSAQAIVGALNKIKPTDGLEKILSEGGKIKEKLLYKSPKATEAFEYFLKIMGELKETMPKAFAGALQNGHQLRALVEEMVLSAVKNGKIEQAKVAMEVLSVIKYGYTTSKIMDAISKEKMTIFSDPGLSWNKTEGVKFVTTAFDKSMKAAFMGVGYAITITGNAIKRSGNKFNGQSERLKKERDNSKVQADAGRIKTTAEQTVDRQRLAVADNTLTNITAQGIDENTPREKAEDIRDTQFLDSYIQLLNNIDQVTNWLADPANAAHPDKTDKQDELQEMSRQLNDAKNLINNNITALQAWIADPANAGSPDMTTRQLELAQAQKQQKFLGLNLADAQTAHNTLKTTMDAQRQRVDAFHAATSEVNFLTKQIENRQKILDTWDEKHTDQYLELMAHWDFIETGSKVHTWALGTKNARKKFDSTKKNQLNTWQTDYQQQYAA